MSTIASWDTGVSRPPGTVVDGSRAARLLRLLQAARQDLRNIPRYSMKHATTVLALFGVVFVWAALGDGPMPPITRLSRSSGLNPYQTSSPQCILEGDRPRDAVGRPGTGPGDSRRRQSGRRPVGSHRVLRRQPHLHRRLPHRQLPAEPPGQVRFAAARTDDQPLPVRRERRHRGRGPLPRVPALAPAVPHNAAVRGFDAAGRGRRSVDRRDRGGALRAAGPLGHLRSPRRHVPVPHATKPRGAGPLRPSAVCRPACDTPDLLEDVVDAAAARILGKCYS